MRRLPRYTSYPTAPHFRPLTTPVAAEALGARSGPLSVYVHIPFCFSLCWYCGCHKYVKRKVEAADPYLDDLIAELDLVMAHLQSGRGLAQLHLGGGTPTFLDLPRMKRLVDAIEARIPRLEGAELSIEIDPRSVDAAYLTGLVELGFTRFSFGVQDFDDEVMEGVNRAQPAHLTIDALAHLRTLGDFGINFDLLYGLPRQTLQTWQATLDRTVELRPSRIALFPYAHVPWMRPSMKLLERAGLPDTEARDAMHDLAHRALTAAGYQRIGMDHYALPGDSLLTARDEGTLHRNFQGYTTQPCEDLVGIGVSSIGYVGGAWLQNHHDPKTWQAEVRAGRLPVARGHVMTDDDLVRGRIIQTLMCYERLDTPDAFRTRFADALDALAALDDVEVDDDGVRVLDPRALRPAAAVFDAWLDEGTARYSSVR